MTTAQLNTLINKIKGEKKATLVTIHGWILKLRSAAHTLSGDTRATRLIRAIEDPLTRLYNRRLSDPIETVVLLPDLRLPSQPKRVNEPGAMKGKVASTKRAKISGLGMVVPKNLTAADLATMNFDTFKLPGPVGEFLGDLHFNKTALVLHGDPSSGKTFFLMRVVQALMKGGLRGKLYLLETGFTRRIREWSRFLGLDHSVEVADDGGLKEIQQDAARKDIQYIMVDSWQSLGVPSKEYEQLRKTYPDTIFGFIFQAREGGQIYGGARPLFDCSMRVHLKNDDNGRIGTMEKSRHGTEGYKLDVADMKLTKPE